MDKRRQTEFIRQNTAKKQKWKEIDYDKTTLSETETELYFEEAKDEREKKKTTIRPTP